MRGKTVLVTGATSGIGLYTAIDLAGRGARVVLVGRDPARTNAAVAAVAEAAAAAVTEPGAREASGPAGGQGQERTGAQVGRSGARVGGTGTRGQEVSSLLCDFSSLAAVRRLAEAFRARFDRLDVLVNNAGGVNKRRLTTVDGFEMTFAVNHLAPFLLTNLLLDLIVRSAPARIVTVSSIGHRQGTLDFDDLGFARGGYSIMRAYSRSKLTNVLFSAELARRLAGTGVTSNSMHPGSVDTNIWTGAPLWAKPIIALFRPFFFITAEQGASYVVDLVTRPDLAEVTGRYFEEGKMVEPSALARDEKLAGRLWEVSAALVGLDA